MEKNLREHMSGIQRVPALLFHVQHQTMDKSGLSMYEVTTSESLHDLKGNISRIWDEPPQHLTENEKSLFLDVKEALLSYKSKLRGCDYRLSAIVMYKHMEPQCREHIKNFLYSVAQLCHLLYIQEYERCPKIILRLHNTAYKHAIMCKDIIGTPKSTTMRHLYGIYWHAIVAEAPLMCRIISPRSICTEEQERGFSTIKEITKRTSSGHANHVIPNSLLRMQAENMMREKPKPVITQNSTIKKYAATLPPPPNTSFHAHEINSYYSYQAHLERIADFLIPRENIWWHIDSDEKNNYLP